MMVARWQGGEAFYHLMINCQSFRKPELLVCVLQKHFLAFSSLPLGATGRLERTTISK